ncbi:related to GPI14 -Glycosylphosphatidylinositol-alpha 1,4 mannosyltransferase I [Melanopsichium pennsylvanicum]|uniref:GPI mannosyltransferase 1 n=2 Tax=Melanopsichium pennsylvanicum TaxID=63383 RepID=A0AAJ4XI99_9BASI|nr:related to GPI14-Glycosylphosphatidylinositol-alpha 1,4 mannosyltransferase I [Melanopsichium pennsylvanicum 4]SNX81668.1 related to GPI14 -Glycosylphosphatidylinositol-alpha 1,4 mannosyltransferase I [Melanopsichium pennsylvanicum]
MKPSLWTGIYILFGLVLRATLLLWGQHQDATHALPYTDVDYLVYSDAARFLIHACPLSHTVEDPNYDFDADLSKRKDVHCAQGFIPSAARFLLLNDPNTHAPADGLKPDDSDIMYFWAKRCYQLAKPAFDLMASLGDPYARPTYRYTPFLAALLSPIHILGWTNFGKYIFAVSDILCAVFMWLILDGRRPQGSSAGVYVHLPGLLWILNPMVAQISTRGSSEALVGLFVLSFLYFFLKTNPEAPLGLQAKYVFNPSAHDSKDSVTAEVPYYEALPPESAFSLLDWSLEAYMAPILLGLATHFKLFPVIYAIPILAHLYRSTVSAYPPQRRASLTLWAKHAAGIQFGFVAFYAFMAANVFAWLLWGSPFIDHSFLYHLHRADHRHNFSPYFLGTYLTLFTTANTTNSLEAHILSSPLLSFLPQLLVVAALGYHLGKRDVVAAMTAQTIAFVAFNKVCTSQYFLWFLWLLPLVWPSLKVSKVETGLALAAWIGGQALWLSQAYQLEFEAKQVFARIWASGLVLLGVHAGLLVWFLSSWMRFRVDVQKHGLKQSKGTFVKNLKSQ